MVIYIYIDGISRIFQEFTNQGEDFEKDFDFSFSRATTNESYFLLKLKALFKNSYVAHAYHEEHPSSLEKTMKSFQPDIVVFTNLSARCYVDDVKKIKPDIKTVLIQHNAEYIVALEQSKYGKNLFTKNLFQDTGKICTRT